jgi:hypothetical protein
MTVHHGLLSALLPMTFIKDFYFYSSVLVCTFSQDIENILPQVQTFLDSLNEITETQFYFEIHDRRIGILKNYDSEWIASNKNLEFSGSRGDQVFLRRKKG